MSAKLTKAQARILDTAVKHRDGVAAFHGAGTGSGLARASWQKAVDNLIKTGCLTPSPFNDYYITDLGRAALTSGGKEP